MSALLERLEREKAERESTGPGINSPGVVLPPPPTPPVEESKKKAVPTAPAPESYLIDVLYVDCMPLSSDEPVIPSYKLIVPAGQTVADDQGVLSALLIDYGKGGPMLACQVLDNLRRHPVKYVYLESRSAEGKAVSMALMGVARQVVKGMF